MVSIRLDPARVDNLLERSRLKTDEAKMYSLGHSMRLVDGFKLVHCLHNVCLDSLLTDAQ